MPKVKAIKRFNDVAMKKGTKNFIREKNDEFEVSEARAKHLVKQGMVEIVEETEKKATKKPAEKEG